MICPQVRGQASDMESRPMWQELNGIDAALAQRLGKLTGCADPAAVGSRSRLCPFSTPKQSCLKTYAGASYVAG